MRGRGTLKEIERERNTRGERVRGASALRGAREECEHERSKGAPAREECERRTSTRGVREEHERSANMQGEGREKSTSTRRVQEEYGGSTKGV